MSATPFEIQRRANMAAPPSIIMPMATMPPPPSSTQCFIPAAARGHRNMPTFPLNLPPPIPPPIPKKLSSPDRAKAKKAKRTDEEDDDYVPERQPQQEPQPPPSPKKKKPKRSNAKRRRERSPDDNDEPPKKKPRKTPRPWSKEEEEIFLAGLTKHGRDWEAIASDLKFRDKKSIRSHAQKHFIHLFFNKIPLPDAVKSTGSGYSLSGKPLDENSAACRSYKNMKIKPKKTEAELRILDPNRDNENAAVNSPSKRKPKKTTREKKGRKKKPKRDPEDYHTSAVQEETLPPRRAHPRRVRRKPKRSGFNSGFSGEEDIHSLLPLQPYCGDQPFKVVICPNALCLADLHAHLSHEVEIIGFLGGRYDGEEKTLFVEAVYPCKSAPVVDNEHNVEADPEAQVEILTDMEKKNMTIVGWYHSHPTFAAQPSIKDVATHQEHQIIFKGDHDFSPFIGLIVGPYTTRCGIFQSEMTFFVVNDEDEPMPMQLYVEHSATMSLTDLFERMVELVDRFPANEYSDKILTNWSPQPPSPKKKRGDEDSDLPWEVESYTGVLRKKNKTRLAKMCRSMYLHVGQADTWEFVQKVVDMLYRKYDETYLQDDSDEAEDADESGESESEDEAMPDCAEPESVHEVIEIDSSSEMDVDEQE